MKINARRTIACFLIATLSVLGCGEAGTTADSGTDTVDDTTPSCETPVGSSFDLEGWWAVRVFVRLTMVEDPGAIIHVCDDPPIVMATVTWLVHFDSQIGQDVPYRFRSCELTLPDVTASFAECSADELLMVYLHTGDALNESLPLIEYNGTLSLQETDGCIRGVTDDMFVRIGIASDFDDGFPLPGWDPDCSGTTALQCVPGYADHVLDTDDDGDPAATFWIETDPMGMVTGTALATLRHTPGINATRLTSGLVTGDLDPMLQYDFVGSDATMAGLTIDTPTVKRNFPDFIPIAEGSVFTMVRIDGLHGAIDLTGSGEDVDCEAVLNTPGLFE